MPKAVNAERFITPELKEYESKVLGAAERISEIERNLFVDLRKEVGARVKYIQSFSSAVAHIFRPDVFVGPGITLHGVDVHSAFVGKRCRPNEWLIFSQLL